MVNMEKSLSTFNTNLKKLTEITNNNKIPEIKKNDLIMNIDISFLKIK